MYGQHERGLIDIKYIPSIKRLEVQIPHTKYCRIKRKKKRIA